MVVQPFKLVQMNYFCAQSWQK